MADETRPADHGAAPADGPSPCHMSADIDPLEHLVHRLQEALEAPDKAPCGARVCVAPEALLLAQYLLRGWQGAQALTQTCLTQWHQTVAALETTSLVLQSQAQMLQTQRCRTAGWAFLASVGVMGLLMLAGGRSAPLARNDLLGQRRCDPVRIVTAHDGPPAPPGLAPARHAVAAAPTRRPGWQAGGTYGTATP
jgi:hypothetical protein